MNKNEELTWNWKKRTRLHHYESIGHDFFIKRDWNNQSLWTVYRFISRDPERIKRAHLEPFSSLYEAKYFAEYGEPLGYKPLSLREKLKLAQTGDEDIVSKLYDLEG